MSNTDWKKILDRRDEFTAALFEAIKEWVDVDIDIRNANDAAEVLLRDGWIDLDVD